LQILRKTCKRTGKAKELLESPQFIIQKGIRSLVDEDARVGYKTKTDSFFGYKTEFTMLTDEIIITAVNVHNGAYVDGSDIKTLIEKKKKVRLILQNFMVIRHILGSIFLMKLENLEQQHIFL